MSFYRWAANRRDILICLLTVEVPVAVCVFSTGLCIERTLLSVALVLAPFLYFFVMCLVYPPWNIKRLTEKINVSESGLNCVSEGSILWQLGWDEIDSFQVCIKNRLLNVDIISPIILHVDISFQLTQQARYALSKYCPKHELLDQLSIKYVN